MKSGTSSGNRIKESKKRVSVILQQYIMEELEKNNNIKKFPTRKQFY